VTLDTEWIQNVAEAQEDLRCAIQQSDKKLLKQVCRKLHGVLSIEPTQINKGLNETARDLGLPSLVTALTSVRDDLIALALDPGRVHVFQDGLDALDSLSQRLETLVQDHDLWQRMDAMLRRVEGLLELDPSELPVSWPDIKAQADRLYRDRADEWVAEMKKYSDALDKILEADNPAKSKQAFRSYRHCAGIQFHNVDVDLKALCDKLRHLGDSLALVLRMIE
jgi:hypothetical protein